MSNMTVNQSSTNISLLNIPKYETLQESANSYPKKIILLGAGCLFLSFGSSWLRDYTNSIDEKSPNGSWQNSLVKNKGIINVVTYPFAEHPVKSSILTAGLALYVFN